LKLTLPLWRKSFSRRNLNNQNINKQLSSIFLHITTLDFKVLLHETKETINL